MFVRVTSLIDEMADVLERMTSNMDLVVDMQSPTGTLPDHPKEETP